MHAHECVEFEGKRRFLQGKAKLAIVVLGLLGAENGKRLEAFLSLSLSHLFCTKGCLGKSSPCSSTRSFEPQAGITRTTGRTQTRMPSSTRVRAKLAFCGVRFS